MFYLKKIYMYFYIRIMLEDMGMSAVGNSTPKVFYLLIYKHFYSALQTLLDFI